MPNSHGKRNGHSVLHRVSAQPSCPLSPTSPEQPNQQHRTTHQKILSRAAGNLSKTTQNQNGHEKKPKFSVTVNDVSENCRNFLKWSILIGNTKKVSLCSFLFFVPHKLNNISLLE